MMNTLLAASVLAVLFSPAPIVQDAKPDFSGTWTMDATKSDFGQMPAPQSIVIVIEHKEPELKATVTQKTSEGEMTSTRNLTTDGKENKNTVRTMDGEQPNHVDVEVGWQGVGDRVLSDDSEHGDQREREMGVGA